MTIKAVAEITGLTEFTLRAWETRYSAVIPERTDSGRRLYTLEDVEKLRLLQQLRFRGHALKEIASLSVLKLSRLMQQTADHSDGRWTQYISDRTPESHVHQLLKCIEALDIPGFMSSLKRSHLEFDTRTYLMEVISPFLQMIGHQISNGELDIYHEHTASAMIRNSLLSLLYSAEQSANFRERPPILLCTPEGDLHEFGILICAVLTVLNGHKVFYLGTNTPKDSVVKAAAATSAQLVVLGISAPKSSLPVNELKHYVEALRSELGPSTHLWVGGSRLTDLNQRSFADNFQKIEALRDFDQALRLWRPEREI